MACTSLAVHMAEVRDEDFIVAINSHGYKTRVQAGNYKPTMERTDSDVMASLS